MAQTLVETKTGAITVVADAGAQLPVALDVMKERLEYIEQFCKDILTEGKTPGEGDYSVIPGTKKPSMLKPGAEKLCFAFGLSPEYDVVKHIDEPKREWPYTKTEWLNGKKTEVTVTACGFHGFLVKCCLVHRQSGITWATQLGYCGSSERGREDAPANTILKMAQKRAYCGATLNATFTSGRFTVDVDGYKGAAKGQKKAAKKPAPEAAPADGIAKLMGLTPEKLIERIVNGLGQCFPDDDPKDADTFINKHLKAKTIRSVIWAENTKGELAHFCQALMVLSAAQKTEAIDAEYDMTDDVDAPPNGVVYDDNQTPQELLDAVGDRRKMLSKYGEENKKSKCSHCGEHHVLEGDPICINDEGKWGHCACWLKDN